MKLLVALTACLAVVYSDSPMIFPGFKIKIGDKFLQELKRLNDHMYNVNRPDGIMLRPLPQGTGMLPAGVQTKDVKLKEHSLGESQLKFSAPNLIKYTINNANLVVEATLKKEGKEGKGTVSMTGINVDMAIAFGKSATDHLTVASDTCQMSINSATVTIDGLSDVPELQTFASTAGDTIKTLVPGLICPQLQMALTMASAQLEQLPNQLPPFEGMTMDVSLLHAPRATDDYIEFEFNGCALSEGDTPGRHCFSNPIADSGDTDHMFYMYATEALCNNFFSLLHTKNFFTHKIAKGDADYDRILAGVRKTNTEIGLSALPEGDYEISVKSLSAPRIDISGEVGSPAKFEMQLQTEMKTVAGAATPLSGKTDMSLEGNYVVRLNQTKAGEMFPRWSEKVEITQLTIDNTIGYELTPTQKTQLAEKMKAGMQRFLNSKFKRFEEYDNRHMEKWSRMGKIDNVYIRTGQKTFEVGFDINVNIDNIHKKYGGHYGGQ